MDGSDGARVPGYWYAEADGARALLRAVREFRRADQAMRRRMSDGMDMNVTDLQALRAVIAAERAGAPLTARALADELGISTASTTKLLDRLTDSGHLRRVAHPTDRRALVVVSTPHAHEEIHAQLGHLHERMAQIAGAVPERARPAVAGFLRALAEEMDRTGRTAPGE